MGVALDQRLSNPSPLLLMSRLLREGEGRGGEEGERGEKEDGEMEREREGEEKRERREERMVERERDQQTFSFLV